MKAFLLAAGLGTRLGSLTRHRPKCLVPVGGKPILVHWLEQLANHGVDHVIVNTHHLANQVEAFAATWKGPPRLTLAHEETLLGTAGTVLSQRHHVDGEEAFFVIYADNLTNADLGAMARFHRSRNSPFTMALFRTPEPEQCGIASTADDGRITAFEEKPRNPVDNLANGGIYLIDPEILGDFLFRPGLDFGFDVIPRLVGRMYGWETDGYLCDIGSPDRLRKAEEIWVRSSREAAEDLAEATPPPLAPRPSE